MQKVLVLSLCELIRIFEILIITVQLQPHQFIFLRSFTATSPREALAQCLAVCPRYATLKHDTRVYALHCHLLVFPGAH